MSRVFLIRHGQTEWNREEIFRGLSDIPLNDYGRQQAKALGKLLKNMELRNPIFLSSPLKRAIETAELMLKFQRVGQLEEANAFIDICFGKWEGSTINEVKAKYPELYRTWRENPELVIFPGGESLDEAANRAEKGLNKAVESYEDRDIIIVSHRAVNKVLLCRLLGAGVYAFWKVHQVTACLNELSYDGTSFVIIRLNDTCHLRHLQEANNY